MNIAILIPTLAYGGAERVAAEISKYFSGNGHNIYIFTEARRSEKYDFAGKIIKLKDSAGCYSDFTNWYGTMYGLLKRASEIRRLKMQYKIDVSISFMELYNMVNILSRTTDKVIIRVCTVLSVYNTASKLYNVRLIKYLYNRADCVVAISNYIRRDLVDTYGVKKKIIKIIPNSIETAQEQFPEDKWVYGENVIICLARVCGEKQQKLLIETFLRIRQELQSVKLLLVGNDQGEYAAAAKESVREERLMDDIIFTGHISNPRYYLEHSKLFVLLSKVEGFGNSTIEALSAGIPVICMDSPGASRQILAPHTQRKALPEIDFAQYGVLLPFVDEDEKNEVSKGRIELISKTIVDLMQDEKKREYYAGQGKKRASMFCMERIGKMWDKVLED